MVDKAIQVLQKLGEGNKDILDWKIEKSIDNRKNTVLIENGLFTDEESFRVFWDSNKHHEAGEFMKQISDWLIGDYIET